MEVGSRWLPTAQHNDIQTVMRIEVAVAAYYSHT